MARLIRSVENQLVTCNVVTKFEDGTESIKSLRVGDVVEGLRYIENHQLLSVTGKIKEMVVSCNQITAVNLTNPQDYFGKDVMITSLVIDASEQYDSKIVTVNAREIVEDEGVFNVVKVDVIAVPTVTLEMSYTDGTIVNQDIVIGDILCDMAVLTTPGNPDIVGDFRLAAFKYSSNSKRIIFTGIYIVPLEGGQGIFAAFDDIIKFTEKPRADVTETDSLAELAAALEANDEVFAFLDTDVTIPKRDDGRITTLMVNAGKSLTVDLGGHAINTQAYAFYVNGGDLTIRDTTGQGKITACATNSAYPAVFVAADGVCTMESGVVDTTVAELSEGESNWLYGVVCSGNGIFDMKGGKIITQDAAGISITNGTASGEGAQFNISGDAQITSNDCTAIYLADNKVINISDKAVINGGILLRMGDLNISGKAVVNGAPADAAIYPLGTLVCESGCENHNAAILCLTGCYTSSLGNDLNINISGYAKVNGNIDNAIDIARVDTKYDQIVNVSVANSDNIKYATSLWNIYDHDTLADLAAAQGKTLPPKAADTTITITVDGKKAYPA